MGRQYLSEHIESVKKGMLKVVFLPLCYEDALKKSGSISLPQRPSNIRVTQNLLTNLLRAFQ